LGGFRAELIFVEQLEVGSAGHILLDLPATPLKVSGTDEPVTRLTGSWFGMGGTKSVAEDAVRGARFIVEPYGDAARIFTFVEAEFQGLVSLEASVLYLPRERDLSLTTEGGDVEVSDVLGHVVVDIAGGDILVDRARRGLELFTGVGEIEVDTLPTTDDAATPVWAVTLDGDMRVHQRGGGDVELETFRGDLVL